MLKRFYFPMIAIVSVLSLVCLGGVAFLYFSDNAHSYMGLYVPLALGIILGVIINAFLLTRYINKNNVLKNLRVENEYNFGFQTAF